MSIFVSWRGSDRDIKNELVSQLRSFLPDEDIWESDERCNSNAYDEFIEQIHKSEIFVVIVSDEAMKPSYVFNEIIEARACEMAGRLNMLVFKTTDSPYVGTFAANLNHLSDANHVARLKGTNEGYLALAKRIKVLLEKRRRGEPENPYDTFSPEIKGTKLSRGYYVPESRNDIFSEFDKAFEKSNILIVTQINGYGRKCAAREYLLRRNDIKNAIILHSFSGSLRQFFTKGIEITNINDEVFKNMEEDDVILAKARLLSRLDNTTAIIVPEYIPGNKDDRFVFDALSTLGCRVIFIAQSVPPLLKNIFPVVSVNRMKDEHLCELFFNYYEASVDEMEQLKKPLVEFFDSIDGHTKSVEITANYIAQEFGIYPDEVEQILKNIHPNSENELAERIFEVISGLFDMTNFGDTEKAILLTAAYFASTPIDEKFFVELLQNAGCYDAKVLRTLIERGWISNDRACRTIQIESFFADVCRGKIEIDQALFASLIDTLTQRFFHETALMSVGSLFSTLNRIGRLFELMDMPLLKKACEQVNTSYYEDAAYFTDTYQVESAKKQIFTQIEKQFTDPSLTEAVTELADCIFIMLASNISLHTPGEQRANSTMANRLLYQSMSGMRALTDILYDELENIENEALKTCIEGFILATNTADINAFIAAYEMAVKMLCYGESVEYIDPFYLVAEHIISCIRSSSYLTLRVCRAWMLLINTYGVYSFARAFNILYIYLSTLDSLNLYDSEFDDVFELSMEIFDNAKKDGLFKKEESLNSDINAAESKGLMISIYINGLIARRDLDDAADKLYSILDITPFSPNLVQNLLLSAVALIRELIRLGDTEEALEITDNILKVIPGFALEELNESARDALSEIELFKEAITENNSDSGFEDFCEEYFDYYRQFATEYSNKRLYRKYEEIANKALKADFSELSKDELLNIAASLRKRAMAGEPKESLAPEAFALISEAGYRVLGYRHHFVQYIGAIAIADGKIAEIQNGEGKTYTIIAAAFLHSLYNKHIYITDSSKILTNRNYLWMRGVLLYLGCKVALLDRSSIIKRQNYCDYDIIYAYSRDLIFEYMEDELRQNPILAPLDVVIADEAEQLLIAEGHVPHRLNTSATVKNNAPIANAVYNVVSSIDRYERNLYFSAQQHNIDLKAPLFELLYSECEKAKLDISMQTAFAEKLLRMCIDAVFCCEKDRDYFIVNGKAMREDKEKGSFTNFSDLFSYFLSRKEGLAFDADILKEHKMANAYIFSEFTYNISLLCGTTATASSMKKELSEIYGLEVVPIPTNIPIRRVDYPPVIFTSTRPKFQHIIEFVTEKHKTGQPLLIVTESVFDSVQLSKLFTANNIAHKLLNAQNADTPADILEEAGLWGAVTIATAVANRGVDIRLGGNPKTLAKMHLLAAGYKQSDIDNADIEDNEISKKISDLTAYYRLKTEAEREKINDLGGLCVIGTACFTDLRTEQQMRGRCGRQGDKGESHVFFSIDDDGFKQLLNKAYQSIRTLLSSQTDEYANLGSIGYLVKAISSSREKNQSAIYKTLLNSPELIYRPQAREEFLGLARKLQSAKYNVRALTDKYFYTATENIEDVMALSIGGKCSNRPINRLAPYMELTGITPRQVPLVLKDAVEKFREATGTEVTDEIIASIIATQLITVWSNFISDMENEVSETRNFYDNTKKFHKHIKLYAEDLCRHLITKAVSAVMAVEVRKTPPPTKGKEQ